MSKQHRSNNLVLECQTCGRKFQFIKHAMKTCGAVIQGAICGGELKPIVKLGTPKP